MQGMAAPSTSTLILTNIVAPLGLLMILGATLVPFVLMHNATAQSIYPFVYGAGALILLAARMFSRFPTDDIKLKRLHRMETWIGAIFLVGVGILFYNPTTLRDFLAFTMAGAVLQIYTSIAIPQREKKLAAQADN